MGYLLGDLHLEREALRRLRCPSGVGGRPVGPVERRLDLDGREPPRIARQMAALPGEAPGVLLGDRPTGAADADLVGRHGSRSWISSRQNGGVPVRLSAEIGPFPVDPPSGIVAGIIFSVRIPSSAQKR
jgi:hypothetical protein